MIAVLLCLFLFSGEPGPDEVLRRAVELAARKQYAEAHRLLQTGASSYPGDKRFVIELAGVAYRQQNRAEARRYLHAALRIDPSDAYAREFLGTLYFLEGNLAAAVRHWNEVGKPLLQSVRFDPQPRLNPLLRDRAVSMAGGQILTTSRLQAADANLRRLNVFTDWRYELAPRPDRRYDLTVALIEPEPLVRRWWGQLLPLAQALPYRSIWWDLTDIRGTGASVTALGRWDPDKRRLMLDYSAPYQLNPRIRYRLFADARDELWDLPSRKGLHLERMELGGDITFALTNKLDWTTGLRTFVRRFQNHTGSPPYADGWSFEQRNSVRYALLAFPERRVRVDALAGVHTGRTGGSGHSSFGTPAAEVKATWYPQAKGDRWTAESRFRAAYTVGQLPFDENFQLGVERDNDLWLRGHAGSHDGRKGSAPMGSRFLLWQTSVDRTVLRLPGIRIKTGVFFDAGRIGDAPPGATYDDRWLPDAGVEAKLILLGNLSWSFVYGRDLRGGRGVFYSAVSR